MMFSRAAPTVLFTAFCLSVAGTYVSGGFQVFSRFSAADDLGTGELSNSYIEMERALQVGDTARFENVINIQMKDMQAGRVSSVVTDKLPMPYEELRSNLMRGDVAQVRALLGAHPGLELSVAQGRYGAVPLIWATGNPDEMPEMIALLLEAGARAEFTTARGYTLVHAMASPFNRYTDATDVAKAMALLPDSLIAQTTNAGLSALHLTLIGGRTEHVVALLARGADANGAPPLALGEDFFAGQPPLMIAGGNVRIVAALLDAGADPMQRDSLGRRILDVVTQGAHDAERALQERLSASAAEEYDRQYASDYARSRDLIRAAVDSRLARGD